MPQRFLRPGLTTSKRFNSVCWQAQSLYVRLITLVDDYGRFEADPMLLKSLAFPFNPDNTCEQMLALCQQLLSANLAIFYEIEGKSYLQLTKWQERARSSSKFPEPTETTVCKQLTTIASKCSPPSPSPSPSPSPASLRVSGPVESPPPAEPPKTKRTAFVKPGIEELKLAIAKAGMPETEAQKFLDWYEMIGWKVGRAKAPMQNWRSAVGNWKTHWEQNRHGQRNASSRNHNTEAPNEQFITGRDELRKQHAAAAAADDAAMDGPVPD